MNTWRWSLAFLGMLLGSLPGSAGEKKVDKVAFAVYAKGYFVKNNATLPGNPAYLLLQDKTSFDKIFGIGFVMGPRPKLVDDKLFEKYLLAIVIKSGKTPWKYSVEQVRLDKKQLIVEYKAEGKENATATFSSPLIVAVPTGEYTEIVFVENGKEVGKQSVKK